MTVLVVRTRDARVIALPPGWPIPVGAVVYGPALPHIARLVYRKPRITTEQWPWAIS